jgi:hypothetical protein
MGLNLRRNKIIHFKRKDAKQKEVLKTEWNLNNGS